MSNKAKDLILVWLIGVLLGLVLVIPFSAEAFTIETLRNVEVRNDFVLGPGKTELFMDPGDSQGRELVVTNRTGRDVLFKIEVEDFVGSRDPSRTTILLGDERGPYSLRDYLNIERGEFTLKHGERARVAVTVRVPFDAEPGGRYGTVLLSAQPPPGSLETEAGAARGGAKIITRLGTLFFVRVSGDIAEDGSLKAFRTLGKKFFSSGPIPFEVLYENNGSVHLNPYGIIEITNILGRKVGEIEVDPWFAMPDSLRFREIKWNKTFLFGRYQAQAKINRGYGDIIDEAGAIFWVIPWRILLAIFATLFLIVLFVKSILSRFEFKRKI
jgi:hypothetical protein